MGGINLNLMLLLEWLWLASCSAFVPVQSMHGNSLLRYQYRENLLDDLALDELGSAEERDTKYLTFQSIGNGRPVSSLAMFHSRHRRATPDSCKLISKKATDKIVRNAVSVIPNWTEVTMYMCCTRSIS